MISVKNPPLQNFPLRYLYYLFWRDPFTGPKCWDLLVSGRFRKVSGSLSGSLHCFHNFIAVPEGSGRCTEACPEACFVFVCISAVPEGSGRLPEACPEACFNSLVYCIPEGSGRFPELLPEGSQSTNFGFLVRKRHKLVTFEVISESKCVWSDEIVLGYCRLFMRHLECFVEEHRHQLPDIVGALHKASAKPLEVPWWHLSLLKAYGWHIKWAPWLPRKKQVDFPEETGRLPEGSRKLTSHLWPRGAWSDSKFFQKLLCSEGLPQRVDS